MNKKHNPFNFSSVYSSIRKTWGEMCPRTKRIESKKKYKRSRVWDAD